MIDARTASQRFLRHLVLPAALAAVTLVPFARAETAAAVSSIAPAVTHYRTAMVDGVSLFYREAGPADAPVVLLLHGFPTSSHMFRNLIPLLADRYHVIAPDYPGFGESAAPDHTTFSYTFAHYADLVDGLLTQLGAKRYAMYVMDYGAPVGYRLALKHPERVSALSSRTATPMRRVSRPSGTRSRPTGRMARRRIARRSASWSPRPRPSSSIPMAMSDVSRIDPDNWHHDQALLDRPGNKDIQLDLFLDYGTNVPLYPQFQAFFRERKPPTLIVWGKNDKIFPADGAAPYLRDLPKAELHMLDTGHFALEDKLDVMAPMIHGFLDRAIPQTASTASSNP